MVDSKEKDKFDLGVKGLRISFVSCDISISRGIDDKGKVDRRIIVTARK